MRSASAGLPTWLAQNNLSFHAALITLTLADGATVYRWTTAEGQISYGGNLFLSAPNAPLVEIDNYNQATKLTIDTLDLVLNGAQSFLIGGKSLMQLAVQKYFAGARVKIDYLIGSDPNSAIAGTGGGVITSFFEGRVATPEPNGASLVLRLKSELVTLNQPIPRFLIMPQCGNAVYDPNCALVKATFTVAGAADGSPTTTSIHTSSAAVTANGSGYYNLGVLKFTSGVNNGLTRAVATWDGHTFTMALPFPSAPAAADTFTVYPGCPRDEPTCNGRFANRAQHRGYPHVPSPEAGSNPEPYPFGPFYSPHRDPNLTGGGANGSIYQPPPLPTLAVVPNTSSAQAQAVPVAYGTVKAPLLLIESVPPQTNDTAAWQNPSTYAPGNIVSANGGAWRCLLGGADAANGRPDGQGTDPDAWIASHSYPTVGEVVQHFDAGAGSVFRVYQVTVAGTSAGSGGPLGTGSDIVDGSVHWQYLGETPFPINHTPDGLIWQYLQQLPYPQNFVTFLGALCEGEIQGALSLWWDQEHYTALSSTVLGKALKLYTGPDAANQVLTGAFDASGYQHTALVGPVASGRSIATGTKKEIPSIAVELQAVMFGAATKDVSPADIVNDLLTHTRRGAGWSSSRVGVSITGTAAGHYRVYCDAAGLRMSMFVDAQRAGLDILADILNGTHSDAVWSGGQLKIVPLGDQPIASPVYGATGYVPANAAQYNLSEVDLREPLQVQQRDDADCFNCFTVEYVDRSMNYQRNTAEDPDQADIDKRGILWRGGAVSLPLIFPDGKAAIMLSRILAQRSLNVRNSYTFTLPWRYFLLEPTDVVTVSDTVFGLSLQPVRLLSMRISFPRGAPPVLTCTAEDYPTGVAASSTYAPVAGDGYVPNIGSTSGSGIPTVFGTGALTSPGLDNIWPNPTSENGPPPSVPVPDNGTSAEWDYRFNAGAGARSGNWVRKLTGPASGTTNLIFKVPCSQDDIAQFAVWAKAVSGSPGLNASIIFLDASGAILATSSVASTAGVWTMLRPTKRAPAGTIWVQASIAVSGNGAVGYFDDIVFKRVPPAGPAGGFFTAGAPIAIDCTYADQFEEVVGGAAHNVSTPTSPYVGQNITIKVKNVSGGATVTAWPAIYKLSAWVDPANGFSRSITFHYDGTNWVEISRTPNDVPN